MTRSKTVAIKFVAPFAFYDDEGVLHSWVAGQLVEDPAEIESLRERGASIEVFRGDPNARIPYTPPLKDPPAVLSGRHLVDRLYRQAEAYHKSSGIMKKLLHEYHAEFSHRFGKLQHMGSAVHVVRSREERERSESVSRDRHRLTDEAACFLRGALSITREDLAVMSAGQIREKIDAAQ
ncbi:hypothetical protein [Lichenicoccus sp.]|uniref:hypothetical protein n=1 Tax=Lichenicoccus sp. TaxID=2781899 RepID=UPI003D1481C7